MFEDLVQKIAEHSKYGPAMQGAMAGNAPLVLNYHNHLGESSYCVSICAREHNPVKLLDTSEETLEELAHIRGRWFWRCYRPITGCRLPRRREICAPALRSP